MSLRRGAPAGDDPWGADTLEWATSSPPPPYNFAHIPVVEGRAPLWEQPGAAGRDWASHRCSGCVGDHPARRRARQPHRHPIPSIWPLLTAIATTILFVTLIFTPWGAVIGTPLLLLALLGWGWPRGEEKREQRLVEQRG